jgi:hypothetical protein
MRLAWARGQTQALIGLAMFFKRRLPIASKLSSIRPTS